VTWIFSKAQEGILIAVFKRFYVMKITLLLLLILNFFAVSFTQEDFLDGFGLEVFNQKVQIKWTIKAGNTCAGIKVMRKTQNNDFVQIDELFGICGDLEKQVSYLITDNNPPTNEILFYRLDFGGNGVSEIKSIEVIEFSGNEYIIKPNPIDENSVLYFQNDNNQDFVFQIFNLRGDLLVKHSLNSSSLKLAQFNLLASGTYLFTLMKENEPVNSIKGKFVKD
jgi:hypothetical protein